MFKIYVYCFKLFQQIQCRECLFRFFLVNSTCQRHTDSFSAWLSGGKGYIWIWILMADLGVKNQRHHCHFCKMPFTRAPLAPRFSPNHGPSWLFYEASSQLCQSKMLIQFCAWVKIGFKQMDKTLKLTKHDIHLKVLLPFKQTKNRNPQSAAFTPNFTPALGPASRGPDSPGSCRVLWFLLICVHLVHITAMRCTVQVFKEFFFWW